MALHCCAGCAGREAPRTDRLRIAIEATPPSIDPRYAADADGSRIAGLVHCSLVQPDAAGGWQPSLATGWTSPDARTWIFELRADARFHDGSPVTPADVVATYRSVLDAARGSPKRAAMPSVRSVEADGPLRVRFRLSADDATFLAAADLGILPAARAAETRIAADGQIGCGPYRVAGATSHAIALDAVAAPGDIALRHLEFRVVPDTVMRTLELESGAIDFTQNALEPDAARHLSARSTALRVTVTPYDASQYLGINHRHPALSDLRVRRAIAMAIDRDGIVANLLAGQAEVADGLLPPHHATHDARVRAVGFDPARARTLLDAAGYADPDGDGPRPRLRLRYTTSTVELRRRIAEAIAAMLAEVGIELSIESYEWGTFFQDIARGDYDLYSLAWIGIRDPDLFRVVFHSAMTPPAGSNRGFFASARMDRLTERGRTEVDAQRRRAIYARVQRVAARRLPYVPLWWPKNVVVATSRLEGFEPSPSGDLSGLVRARLR